jgi:hypothetical protein
VTILPEKPNRMKTKEEQKREEEQRKDPKIAEVEGSLHATQKTCAKKLWSRS